MKVTKQQRSFLVKLNKREMNLLCSIADGTYTVLKGSTESEKTLARNLYNGLCNADFKTKKINYAGGELYPHKARS